ncbi:peptide deformylase [Thalassorhabdomicrobium marinisediminis]|uniref:Peptide deformylase-like n=1 Tax=Thalassorhabdomicrobium marinisediminis TaxID=2170577 RepID=A0A2T7FW27_9RHOB|nr:peptide deformylase [Thalassorhabdomicrobium marinisediminis]PVA06359.1 peptide deformylase [Thalassorhabdomicrobium marinisediminis]
MPHRPFVPYPARVLRTPAREVEEITDEVRALWDEMIEAMDAMPGVGLAAPQLGVALRLAVVDASDKRGQAVRLANPTILLASHELRLHEEASPNVPGVSAALERPRAVTVRFINEAGQPDEQDFVGLWATSVQHQIDHLNGKMYFDRLSRTKRDMLLKKARKLNG